MAEKHKKKIHSNETVCNNEIIDIHGKPTESLTSAKQDARRRFLCNSSRSLGADANGHQEPCTTKTFATNKRILGTDIHIQQPTQPYSTTNIDKYTSSATPTSFVAIKHRRYSYATHFTATQTPFNDIKRTTTAAAAVSQTKPKRTQPFFRRSGKIVKDNDFHPPIVTETDVNMSSCVQYPSPRLAEFNSAFNQPITHLRLHQHHPPIQTTFTGYVDDTNPGLSLECSTLTQLDIQMHSTSAATDIEFQNLGDDELQDAPAIDMYDDLGDCDQVCQHCGALFWYEERLKTEFKDHKLRYNRCCRAGKVVLPTEPEPPDYITSLYANNHFLQNIRAYNQMFSMTSFGAHIDQSINTRKGPYVFKISGQIYHWIGSLCPTAGDPPRFLQLYIFDTQNEVHNRMHHFGGQESSDLNPKVVEGLIGFLNNHNGLVKLFRTAAAKCQQNHVPDFKIRLFSVVGLQQYELPTSETLGAIVFESGPKTQTDYDIIIESKAGIPQRINKLHPAYMSLQFPLIFIYGQPGYDPKMKLTEFNDSGRRRRLTMNMYYSYQLHDRFNNHGLLLKAGRLLQQYVVNAYCSIELSRMDYIRQKQQDIRNEYLSGIYDAINRGDHDGSDVGTRTILPTSFTGGPRYMYSHYLDALAICRVHGNPQFFITFTCNVKWPEIKRSMKFHPQLTPADKADIVVRVFKMKVHRLLAVLKERKPFGHVKAVLYTIEFQKRGLPHCHTLLWVTPTTKIENAADVDNYISAELPDPKVDPAGYNVVSEMMMHGPCGLANTDAPCMKLGICSKKFPKSYNEQSYFDKDGYMHYRRRNTSIYARKQHMSLDNSYVVPYNRLLCLIFHAHINVEYCGWTMLIKYLFKYISKGTDRVVAKMSRPVGESSTSTSQRSIHVDEIKIFIDARYICPHEAFWRIFDFDIHHREPPVQILAVHQENMQQLSFRARQRLKAIVNNSEKKKTTLTEWLAYNSIFDDGRHLTYLSFPKEYVWYATQKRWTPRARKEKPVIGRLTYVHPTSGEVFYLRMLLCHQKGCKSFEDIKTVNHIIHPTYWSACEALGLLTDDKEWDTALQEATISGTSSELRSLFAQILIFCEVANPVKLWKQHWRQMADDIPQRISSSLSIRNLFVNSLELEGYVLYELQLLLNYCSKSLNDFGLPSPPQHLLDHLKNNC